MRRRAAILLAWLAAACVQAQPGPPQHDEGTGTEPGTTGDDTTGDGTSGTSDDGSSSGSGDTAVDPECGNGITEAPEECDLAEQNGTGMYCRHDCRANACGDGYLGPGETCDDGNRIDEDRCTSDCAPAACGDGAVQAGEECDDGEANADDGACLTSCIAASCGDGLVQQWVEACDGDEVLGYSCPDLGYTGGVLQCTADCQDFDISACYICGDDELDRNEECDGTQLDGQTCQSLGFGGGSLYCDFDCTFTMVYFHTCGNDDFEVGEECDGTDLAGMTCASVGLGTGTLGCTPDCMHDVSGCTGG